MTERQMLILTAGIHFGAHAFSPSALNEWLNAQSIDATELNWPRLCAAVKREAQRWTTTRPTHSATCDMDGYCVEPCPACPAAPADTLIGCSRAEPSRGGMRPERANWTETETWERPDGSRYMRSRSRSRWAGTAAAPGAWERWDLCEEGLQTRAEACRARRLAKELRTLQHESFSVVRSIMWKCEVGAAPGVAKLYRALPQDRQDQIAQQTGKRIHALTGRVVSA